MPMASELAAVIGPLVFVDFRCQTARISTSPLTIAACGGEVVWCAALTIKRLEGNQENFLWWRPMGSVLSRISLCPGKR